jgi:hypothetical protein
MSKRHVDYTMSDLVRLKYSLFTGNLPEEKAQTMISAMEYAYKIASAMGKNIGNWRVIEAFGSGNGVSVVTDLSTINRIVCTHQQIDGDSELVKMLNEKAKDISTFVSNKSALIREEEQRIEGSLIFIQRKSQEMMSRYENIYRSRQRIIEISSSDMSTPIVSALKLLDGSDFITYKSHTLGTNFLSISFKTEPIIINRGMDNELYVGTYIIKFKFGKSGHRVYVHCDNDNIFHKDYYHPYVDTSGSICWGNATNQAGELLTDFKFTELIGLLKQLLTTYSDDTTPWMSLNKFHQSKAYTAVTSIMSQIRLPEYSKIRVVWNDIYYTPAVVRLPTCGMEIGQHAWIRLYDSYTAAVSVYNYLDGGGSGITEIGNFTVPTTIDEYLEMAKESMRVNISYLHESSAGQSYIDRANDILTDLVLYIRQPSSIVIPESDGLSTEEINGSSYNYGDEEDEEDEEDEYGDDDDEEDYV